MGREVTTRHSPITVPIHIFQIMSLAKIPIIITFAVALRVSLTAPNPPPPDKGRLKKQAFGSWYTQKFLRLFTSVDLAIGLLEIFSILIPHLEVFTAISTYLPFLAQLNNMASTIYPSFTDTLACLMMLTGAFIRVRTFQALGKLFTFEASIQREHRLVTSGPYAFVRHPAYTGLIIANPSWFLWHLGNGSFFNATGLGEIWWVKVLVVMWGMSLMGGLLYLTLGRMQEEDRALKKEFGREWDEYARRVPYSVLPGIY